jgi:hypothetical protein
MPNTAGEILVDIRDTLRSAGLFSTVSIGADADAAAAPRAEIAFIGLDESLADDVPRGRQSKLRARVAIHAKPGSSGDVLDRLLDLAGQAGEALLTDRFRGNRCRDLPVGRATEIGRVSPEPGVKPPAQAVGFDVYCHYLTQEAR